jgi:hypothetical protein
MKGETPWASKKYLYSADSCSCSWRICIETSDYDHTGASGGCGAASGDYQIR